MVAWRRVGMFLLCALGAGGVLAADDDIGRGVAMELARSFQKDLVEAWYPRSIDKRYGGFVTEMDPAWEETQNQDKFLVGQARHVWMLSQLAVFLDKNDYADAALEGKRFLVDAMWDEENGGFFESVSKEGVATKGQEKTAYGMSFSIYALSSLAAATGDGEALKYAQKAFYWMEKHSWDEAFGGYVNRMGEDGTWLAEGIHGLELGRGTVGMKDYNSSIHLLECLTSLYAVWPDELVRTRLESMLSLIRDRFVGDGGYLRLYFYRDWTHLDFRGRSREFIIRHSEFDHVSWGHDVETAFLMLEAEHALGEGRDERTRRVAKRLVDHALDTGWDAVNGSLYEGGYYFSETGPCEVINSRKVWWIAAEGLNATLMMSQLYPDEERYKKAFEQEWLYIKKHFLDERNGGWYAEGTDSNPSTLYTEKAFRWKTSYHDGRAYMNCLRMLRGQFALTQH